MQQPIEIQISQDPECSDLPIPSYQTEGSSGMDLRAAVTGPVTIAPKGVGLVPTGLRVAIPHGHEGQVRARSGLALKHGIGVLNGPGTIDSDYRGPVNVILFNFGEAPFVISRGDRIAQLVICRVERAHWVEASSVDSTKRGDGGFGHTGVK